METDARSDVSLREQRDRLLQLAVTADEKHLADPAVDPDDYLNPAVELMAFDRHYGTWAPGSPGPDSTTWTDDDGPLEYVRTQWADHIHNQPADTQNP